MIIKGNARGRAVQLAKHLLRADQNEMVRLLESRGTLSDEIPSALAEMEAHGEVAASRRPLYHASISPERITPLSDLQVRRAVDLLEQKLGLAGQPRIIVLHRKSEREHVHVVWSRINLEDGKAIPDSWNFRHHEEAARELEVLFGHRPLSGSRALRKHRTRTVKDYELRQAERSGISLRDVTRDITAIWQEAGSGQEFRKKLKDAGYVLARGDRRVFVIIDRAGEVHSLARRIAGANAKVVRNVLNDVDLAELPTVADVRSTFSVRRKRPPVQRSFVNAAREVAARSSTSGVPRSSIFSPLVEEIGSARAPTIQYRSLRAIVIAAYASRIADALTNAPNDERSAILDALTQERAAALNALGECEQPKVHSVRRRRRRPIVRARSTNPPDQLRIKREGRGTDAEVHLRR